MTEDYRIFVGAFPGGELAEQIQTLRLRVDRRTAEITPPHVTLAGTYWRSGPATEKNEAAAIRTLAGLEGKVAAFELVLDGIGVFPGRNPVIHLKVEVTPGLVLAREKLLAALGADKHRVFSPHLTLAMRLDERRAAALLAELDGSAWQKGKYTAPIRELRLMQRGPGDAAWRCIFQFALRG